LNRVEFLGDNERISHILLTFVVSFMNVILLAAGAPKVLSPKSTGVFRELVS